ncbi:MAG: hypothetical protein V1750_07595, partial [Acidobacteriota bacterium]
MVTMRRRWTWALIAVAACRTQSAIPGPQIAAVEPDTGANDADVPIIVRGHNFFLDVTSAPDGTGLTVSRQISVALGGYALPGATLVDSETVQATVPAGLPPGAYALRVVTPAGATAERAGAFQVIEPPVAVLAAKLSAAPATVSLGQTFAVVLEVTEENGVAVLGVAPSEPRGSGSGLVVRRSAPAPADLPAYSSRAFVWLYEALLAGEVVLATEASGYCATTGAAVATAAVETAVTAQTAPQLSGSLTVEPVAAEVGEVVVLQLAVDNSGQAMAAGLTPGLPVSEGAAALGLDSAPPPFDLAGGASHGFFWTYRAQAPGQAIFTVAAAGVDANSGEPVALAPAISSPVAVRLREEAVTLVSDPLADASTFAFVFTYGGYLYLGPRADGTGAVRLALPVTGSGAAEEVSFVFTPDTTGNPTRNLAAPPLVSIGGTGCAPDTNACGPDNEDGRGLFAAGQLAGSEWLVIGGGRSLGDLNYIYMTSDLGPAATFSYVDLSAVLGAATRGISALHVHQERLYLGFPDTGGKRPYLVAVLVAPVAPGLDAISDAQAMSLAADKMPGVGLSAPVSLIDSIADFNDRLYLANNGGWVRSTTSAPQPFTTAAADWQDCTPSAPAYGAAV